jgi:hydroxymethylpyrimidine pyrophosphatase-like HAD family hydrolase
MRYLVLACDYDGTLAHHGRVNDATLAGLERVRSSGRKLVLVTGRELPELQTVFPHLDLFELVVAENGALLYQPATREEKTLAAPPPEPFLMELQRHGVEPMSVGRVIVATWHPHEATVLEAIRHLGLELQVIFNKDAVMVLPSGVNKATGLTEALKKLSLSPHNVVGIGDAENDHAFLSMCECAVAVDNALPMVKETADFVTRGDHGAGVLELIEEILAKDLQDREQKLTRHHILLGTKPDGEEVRVRPYATNVLIAGPSGSGKSTVATGLLERLGEKKYQFCIIDPEGDYSDLEGGVVLGVSQRGPSVEEVLKLLAHPDENAVVNLVGHPLTERPVFFLSLLPHLLELRSRTGRPHWLIVDEAHHLLPASWQPVSGAFPQAFDRMAFITVHPDQIAPAVLALVDTVVAVGQAPQNTIEQFCTAAGIATPELNLEPLASGEIYVWKREWPRPVKVRGAPCRTERQRHVRKYAEGELPPERSFYFRGAEGKLHLRAQNLILFLQLAEGVDDDTWMFHLRRGDYSQWFRSAIKDQTLAAEVARVEERENITPEESRKLIKAIVEQHYTLPAAPVLVMPGTDAAHSRVSDKQKVAVAKPQ